MEKFKEGKKVIEQALGKAGVEEKDLSVLDILAILFKLLKSKGITTNGEFEYFLYSKLKK